MNSCFKLQDVLDNYSNPIAMAFEHLPGLMAIALTTFPKIGELRKISHRGLIMNTFCTFSLKSVLSSFSELSSIKYKQKFTANRLLTWQILLRDQNLKWSEESFVIFCSVEMLCSNYLLFCSGRTFISSMLLI